MTLGLHGYMLRADSHDSLDPGLPRLLTWTPSCCSWLAGGAPAVLRRVFSSQSTLAFPRLAQVERGSEEVGVGERELKICEPVRSFAV